MKATAQTEKKWSSWFFEESTRIPWSVIFLFQGKRLQCEREQQRMKYKAQNSLSHPSQVLRVSNPFIISSRLFFPSLSLS